MLMSKYDRNRRAAWNYFLSLGLIPVNRQHEYVLHHIDDKMKSEDPERYKLWRPQDLWPIERKDHVSLHRRGRERLPFSDSWKKHISEATRKAMDNDNIRKICSEASKGLLCWNNGIENVRSKECPGAGWTRGRLPNKVKRKKN